MSFKDYFSQHASDYAQYRPDYPPALFEYLASLTLEHNLAWDCATGNGQAALGLTPFYRKIIASDASAQQIQSAKSHPQITYQVMPAEQTTFADKSVDLICVAQAMHWFDFDKFYAEVERILKPTGILAAWCYSLFEIDNNPAANKIIATFYWDITNPYWAPERQLIDKEYKTILFPFKTINTPTFFMERTWNLEQLLHYINTWSGVKNYETQRAKNPLTLISDTLLNAWGDPQQTYLIRWPIHLLIGFPASSNREKNANISN